MRYLRALVALLALPSTAATQTLSVVFISDSFSSELAPALAVIREQAPAGVFLIGDMPHENPGAACSSAASCLAKFRAMYTKLYTGQTPLGMDYKREIRDAGIPLLGRINDDHEIRDNVSNNFKWWPQAVQAFAEFHVIPPDNGLAKGYLYQSVQVGPALFLLLDVRSHRETVGELAKTILGAEQKVWLEGKLAECAALPWCVLVSPVPVNPGSLKQDAWLGFPRDRAWLEQRVAGMRNVLVVSGDCHWGSIALPPLTVLPEMNIPQLNAGFSNTCSASGRWTLNSTKAGTGFGRLDITDTRVAMRIYNGDGTLRFLAVVSKETP